METEIATPFGLAMTTCGVKKFNAFVLDLLSNLKTEVSQLSKTDAEDAQSIIGFTEVSIHEAIREEKHPQLIKLSLKGLSTSVKRFEDSHPKLVRIVNSICNTLSNIGI